MWIQSCRNEWKQNAFPLGLQWGWTSSVNLPEGLWILKGSETFCEKLTTSVQPLSSKTCTRPPSTSRCLLPDARGPTCGRLESAEISLTSKVQGLTPEIFNLGR